MKVCILGNSHCGALISAWRAGLPNAGGISLTFFAAPSRRQPDYKVSDGVLLPTSDKVAKMLGYTSGGRDRVIPSEYDRFLVYGMIAQPPAIQPARGRSLALREAILRDRFENSRARKTVTDLRRITDKPIDVAPAPYRAAPAFQAPAIYDIGREPEEAWFTEAFARIGAGYVPQPDATIVSPKCRATRTEFSEGSTRLEISANMNRREHEAQDLVHANEAYGRIWLQSWLEHHLLLA